MHQLQLGDPSVISLL